MNRSAYNVLMGGMSIEFSRHMAAKFCEIAQRLCYMRVRSVGAAMIWSTTRQYSERYNISDTVKQC